MYFPLSGRKVGTRVLDNVQDNLGTYDKVLSRMTVTTYLMPTTAIYSTADTTRDEGKPPVSLEKGLLQNAEW